MAKDRIDRKELRAPDEFIVATTSAFGWIQENARLVLGAVGVAVAVFLAIGVYLSGQASQRRAANNEFAAALATLRAGNYQDAAAALDGIAEQWRGTAVGSLATVLAASGQLRSGDTTAALKTLVAVDGSGLPARVAQQRDMIWGSALEANGDWTAAAARYGQAAAVNGPYSADAMVAEARCWARAGERERANELYRKALVSFPDRLDASFIHAQIG